MKTLSREDFLSPSAAIKPRKVEVPVLGGSVYVRSITVRERDEFERAMAKRRGRDARPRIAALVACDETGRKLFTEADIALLRELPASALEPIIDAHVEVNGMSQEDIDDLEKN